MVLCGLAGGWPTQRILDLALGFAASVCGLRGATSTDRGRYRSWCSAAMGEGAEDGA
jgi:fructokinase